MKSFVMNCLLIPPENHAPWNGGGERQSVD
jgi:hypothetical protein